MIRIGDFMTQNNKEKNKEKIYAFAKYISSLRKEHEYTLEYVAKKTNIKTTSLHKLENGEFQKINSVFLVNLAKLYNINVLTFHIMLGYIKEDEIIQFSEILKNQKYVLKEEIVNQSLKIPVLKSKESFLSDKYKNYLNIINSDNGLLAFFSSKKFFIFKKTDILNKDDIGIFEIQGKIHIGKYALKENFVFISDLISSDVFFREKSEISILGKVFYIIEVI